MIKECKVLSYNKWLKIAVIECDGMKIQITCDIEPDTKKTYVKCEKGVYRVVSKEEYEKTGNKINVKKKEKIDGNVLRAEKEKEKEIETEKETENIENISDISEKTN